MNKTNSIYSGAKGWSSFQKLILDYSKSGIYVLVDENTRELCLPLLIEKCTGITDAVVIEIQGNEANKTISGIKKYGNNLLRVMRSGIHL